MKGKVLAGRLNVRARPDLQGKIIGKLLRSTVVDILGEKGEWFEIKHQDFSAFVYSDFIEVVTKVKSMKGVVTASLLNVRAHPSLLGEVIGGLVRDTVIDILAQHGDWLEIEFNDGLGFVHGDYVRLIDAERALRGKVTAGLLNVRRQPNLDSEVAGRLVQDSIVSVVSRMGNWFEIQFNGSTAFVHRAFIGLLDEEVAPDIPIADQDDEGELPDKIPHAPDLDETHDTLDTIPLAPSRMMEVSGTSEEMAVARTWNKFGNLLEFMSEERGIDPASAVAVLCVESSGKGFEKNNRNKMIIRFENHKFWTFWGKKHSDVFIQHFQYKKGKAWKEHKWRSEVEDRWQNFHGNQAKEWKVLDFARSLDDSAALQSISMGAPQIMGFHHERIGYDTVQEMFEKLSSDIRFHILGLFDFFDQGMVRALQKLDFVAFAGAYNGSGQKEFYGKKIRDHYQAFKKLTA